MSVSEIVVSKGPESGCLIWAELNRSDGLRISLSQVNWGTIKTG